MKNLLFLQPVILLLMALDLQSGVLTIDYKTIINPSISPMVFGVNAGVYDGSYDSSYSTLAANLNDAGVKSIRWPGGTMSDTYDWYRSYWEAGSSGNWWQGPNVPTMQNFCAAAGADVYNTVNLGMCFPPANGDKLNQDPYWNVYPMGIFPTRPPNGPFFASQWVKYCNIDLGTTYGNNPAHWSSYDTKYWEIGNEPWYCTPAQYNQKFREYVTNMKKIDPTVKIAGPCYPNLSGTYQPNGDFALWMTNLLITCGDVVDLLCFHRYNWPPNQNYSTLLTATSEWDSWLPLFHGFIQKYAVNLWGRPVGAVKIALTEWNANTTVSFSDKMGELLYCADTLGEFIKNDVFIAHYWALQNATFLPMYGGPSGFTKNSAHYAFKFMSTHVKNILVKSTSFDANLTCYASRYSNYLSFVVVNKSSSADLATTINLNIAVSPSATVYETTTLADSTITPIGTAGSSFSWTFKKYSVTCIKMTIQSNSPPATPQLVSPLNGNSSPNTTPLLVWNNSASSGGVSNYTVEISTSPSFTTIQQTGIVSTTNYLTSSLSIGTWYWHVRAMDKKLNIGTNSAVWSFNVTTVAIPPTPPQLVSPANGPTVLSSTPLLVWRPSTSAIGITNYTIEISSSSAFSSIKQTGISLGTNYWASALPEGRWYWRVWAKDKDLLVSTNGAVRSFIVDHTIPIKGGTYYQGGIFNVGSQQLTNSLQAVFLSGYSTSPVNFSSLFSSTLNSTNVSMNSNFIGSYELTGSQDYSVIPVQFTLKYSAEMIPAGHAENQIGLYSYNGLEWVKIEGTLDTVNNVFIFNSNKLTGEYAFFVTDPNYIVTKKKPASPDVTQWSYNPFSPNSDNQTDVTRLELNITSVSKLSVRIFDRDRRLVRDLVNAPKVSGKTYIEWDGKDDNGKLVAPGAYIYLININNTPRKGVIVVAY